MVVSSEMTTSPRAVGGLDLEAERGPGPGAPRLSRASPSPAKARCGASRGKEITLVGPRRPKVSRLRRAMARSPRMVRLSSASDQPKAFKIFPALFLILSGFSATFLWRLLIQILMDSLLFDGLGIMDAMVEDANQDLVKALGDVVQVPQGQLAFVQLAVSEDIVDDLLHHSLDTGGGGIAEGPGGGLRLVRQEDQPGFLGLGPGPGIPIVLGFYRLGVGRLGLGLMVKIGDKAGAVMLLDDVGNGLSQLLFPGQVHPVLDVGDENQATQGGSQLFVLVFPVHLVFHEIDGLF